MEIGSPADLDAIVDSMLRASRDMGAEEAHLVHELADALRKPDDVAQAELLAVFRPEFLIVDRPHRLTNWLRALRVVLLAALAAFLWWQLTEVLSAFSHALHPGQLSFLAGWTTGTFKSAKAARGQHDFIPLLGVFSIAAATFAATFTLTVTSKVLDLRKKSRVERLRQVVNAALAYATLRLAGQRRKLPSAQGEASKVSATLQRISERNEQSADVIQQTMQVLNRTLTGVELAARASAEVGAQLRSLIGILLAERPSAGSEVTNLRVARAELPAAVAELPAVVDHLTAAVERLGTQSQNVAVANTVVQSTLADLSDSQLALLRSQQELRSEVTALLGQLASADDRQSEVAGPASAGSLSATAIEERRPLWQAFTDGIGGTLDVFGVIPRTSHRPRSRTTLAEDARALCLALGHADDDHNEDRAES